MDVNILLFPDFETLDAFGPAEVLGSIDEYRLRFISLGGGIVTSKQGVPVLTEALSEVDYSAILLIPGGFGTRTLVNDSKFISKVKELASQCKYCLTVCTGSALLAKTGLLDGRKATSNKRSFEWVKSVNSKVKWIGSARWVIDGKYYTSSGVSAGMDMTLGFVSDKLGEEIAKKTANRMEYVWNSDKYKDLFAYKG